MPRIVLPASRRGSIKNNTKLILTSFLIASSDQLTKYLAINLLHQGETIPILPDMFHLTLVYNTGGAFGIFRGNNVLFIFTSLLIILWICGYIFFKADKGTYPFFLIALILGGAVGNLLDRIRFGFVVDFLDFRIWPVFNIADSAITVGASFLCILYFLRLVR